MKPKRIFDQVIDPGRPWARVLQRGQRLRIVDLHGKQGVDFLCYNAHHPAERYHAPNTLKASLTLKLTKGHILYSDDARPMFTIVKDTCGGHDTIGGCCSAASNQMLYGVRDKAGCRENFLEALSDFGLGRRDIVPNVNFFCEVPVMKDRGLASSVFVQGKSRPGDYVELEAQMDVLAVISNCPQVCNPCNDGEPTAIKVMVFGGR